MRAAPCVTVLAMGCLAVAAAARGQDAPAKRHALVIGLNKSDANIEGVTQLFHAEDDARAIVKVLEDQRWEDIVPLIHSLARRETIVAELARLGREARKQDTVLVYFAGHGVMAKWAEQSAKAHSYWLAYDATLASLEVNGLRLEHVMDYVDDIPAARKLVILDHCHSGSVDLPKTGGAGGGGRDGTGTLKVKRELFLPQSFNDQVVGRVRDEGLLILGSATDTAYELPTLRHGLFTYVLLQALTGNVADVPPAGNNDGKLSSEELVKYLNANVPALATTNNVAQQAIYLTRGNVLDWDILALPQDPDRDKQALLATLGALAGRSALSPSARGRPRGAGTWRPPSGTNRS
jgi:uncharacterized caspase-like protein